MDRACAALGGGRISGAKQVYLRALGFRATLEAQTFKTRQFGAARFMPAKHIH